MFRYKNKHEKKILIQIWTMVIGSSSRNHFTNTRKRNNVIFDTFRSILTDPKHLDEVIKPLDNENLVLAKNRLIKG